MNQNAAKGESSFKESTSSHSLKYSAVHKELGTSTWTKCWTILGDFQLPYSSKRGTGNNKNFQRELTEFRRHVSIYAIDSCQMFLNVFLNLMNHALNVALNTGVQLIDIFE